MKLTIKRRNKENADGTYTVRASGCVLAYLYWADENGMLENHTCFGIVPLNASNSTGSFVYRGERAVPDEATHILVRAVSEDFKTSYEELFTFENEEKTEHDNAVIFHAMVLSDLHTVNKVGVLNRALETVKGSDCLLLTGDMTNNGTEAEFSLVNERINAVIPDVPVYQVNGNHDLFSNETEEVDVFCERLGDVDIIGINACRKWDVIMPVSDEQLNKVDDILKQSAARYHIIMIHTPLRRNMPVRNGHLSCYISCDKEFQKLIDSYSDIIVLSGHTHLSPSLDSGVVSHDDERNNIYINCGSIRPT